MKYENHLTGLEKKVLSFMLENNLSESYTKRKRFELKPYTFKECEKDIEELELLKDEKHNTETRVTLHLAISQLKTRLEFFKINNTTDGYLFNKQLIII